MNVFTIVQLLSNITVRRIGRDKITKSSIAFISSLKFYTSLFELVNDIQPTLK